MILTQGSLRQQQVCDALRCSGLHVRYNDAYSEFLPASTEVGNLVTCIVMGIDYCNY